MRRTNWAITITLLFAATLPACAQLTDAQIVDNAYPKELYDSRDPDAPMRFSAFVAADLNRNRETLLIALYTNGTRAAVSVINRGGQVLSHPVSRSLKGFKGEIELVDLDADGVPEIVVRLYSGHGPMIPDTWIYAWRNSQLALISPTQRVHTLDITLFSQIAPVDLDGTGKLAILAFSGEQRDDDGNLSANDEGIVYALANGRYVETNRRFLHAQAFFRRTGIPKPAVESFRASPGAAALTIINGVEPGAAVDSAQVALNGSTIAEPSAFKPKTRVLTIPVQLASVNRLSVELAGKPGAGIWIIIEPKQ